MNKCFGLENGECMVLDPKNFKEMLKKENCGNTCCPFFKESEDLVREEDGDTVKFHEMKEVI